ncbi:hypothetical protein BDV23DRAFT_150988 [Aspergillus alliaceus]|uniref:Uncharacterized protein n=1 Tax=Petromyces alliaceus TaxID=209559 RepID=A0A5N7CGV5_PETAA|nr:uncharacterized protein BDW43DRAFT_49833 [Aspergillus alliaceus]KAB8234625.1 hypothetical protein BDW43DRAFT_49833 [Aspergillus alliaceus]KAE8392733.1 hypothetical protein BDV23DRAFT_150988 [Aspergillus alliaceus]
MDTANNGQSLESSAHPPIETTGNTADQVTTQISATQQPETEIYVRLKSYPFILDQEFAKGLAIILGHPDAPATETEIGRSDDLVLQAKCFYFSRKEKLVHPVNFAAYKAWLNSDPPTNTAEDEAIGTTSQQLKASAADIPSSTEHTIQTSGLAQEPTYPSSFAHIVELITTGQPIPGIQQIPDTVLKGRDTPSTKPKRRKPWEKEEAGETSQA